MKARKPGLRAVVSSVVSGVVGPHHNITCSSYFEQDFEQWTAERLKSALSLSLCALAAPMIGSPRAVRERNCVP